MCELSERRDAKPGGSDAPFAGYGVTSGDRKEGAMQNSLDTGSSPLDEERTPGIEKNPGCEKILRYEKTLGVKKYYGVISA